MNIPNKRINTARKIIMKMSISVLFPLYKKGNN